MNTSITPPEFPGLAEFRASLTDTDDPNAPYEPAISAVHRRVHSYVYRIPGLKTGREHHLLSRLEYNAFLYFEFLPYLNIREQFEVPLALSLHLAKQLGIKHPFNWRAKAVASMTTDFVLSLPNGGWLAVDVKPSEKLANKRVRQKLTLATACWDAVGVKHVVTTEKEQDSTTVANYRLLHPLALPVSDSPFSEADTDRASTPLREALSPGKITIREAAVSCERKTGLGRGRLCAAAMWLVAHRIWAVDLTKPLGPDYTLLFVN